MKSPNVSNPIAICHLITELSTGGAQVALYRLLAGLDRERYLPIVACLYNGDAEIAEYIRSLGVPVFDLKMNAKWRVDAFWRLFQLLRETRPTILHTWLFHANISGRMVGRLARTPIIIASERTMGKEEYTRLWVNRLTAPLVDKIICVSQQVHEFAEQVIHLPPEKLVVIPNGVPIEDFARLPNALQARAALDLPTGELLIGSIGRMHRVKGYDFLLDAFSRIAASHTNSRLLMVGDGPELDAMKTKTSQLGLEQRVTFLGKRNDIAAILPAMDIFVLPSLHEGMPNAVLEAMAARLCVVASSVGGIPELVIHGQTGLLVPPRDSEALANALISLLNAPQMRSQMGQTGRKRALEHYSIQSNIDKTQKLYEHLLESKRSVL